MSVKSRTPARGKTANGTKAPKKAPRRPSKRLAPADLGAQADLEVLGALADLTTRVPVGSKDGPSASTKPAKAPRKRTKGKVTPALLAQGQPDVGGHPDDLRRHLFVNEYLLCGLPGKAAEKAGFNPDQGNILLADPRVLKAIHDRLENLKEKTNVGVEYVLNKLRLVVERCMADIPVLDHRTGQPTGVYSFDSKGANQALRMLGDYLRMFAEVVEFGDLTKKDPAKMTREEKLEALRNFRVIEGGKGRR